MKKFLKYIAVIFGVFTLDFISKIYVLRLVSAACIKAGNPIDIYNPDIVSSSNPSNLIEGIRLVFDGYEWVFNFFDFRFVWNKGVSFSAFNNFMPILLIVGTALIICWLLWYLFKKAAIYERLPLAFIIGGALGNLVDRIRFGAVVDFIQFHIGNFWWFPAVFNVGDVFITLGVCLYLIRLVINKLHNKRNNKG